MNKFTYALALGAGLVLSLAAPNAQADPIVQSLTTADMSASQFNSLFTPTPGIAALTQNYSFINTGTAGTVTSQVFTGTGAATGVYAYAYQFTVNNATDSTTEGTDQRQQHIDAVQRDPGCHRASRARMPRPMWSRDGAVGSLAMPAGGSGMGVQSPSTIAWQPGTSTGSLTFQYLNPTTGTGPLAAGATSGHDCRALLAARLAAECVREPSEPGAAEWLSGRLVSDNRRDRRSARARARDRSGLDERDRRGWLWAIASAAITSR